MALRILENYAAEVSFLYLPYLGVDQSLCTLCLFQSFTYLFLLFSVAYSLVCFSDPCPCQGPSWIPSTNLISVYLFFVFYTLPNSLLNLLFVLDNIVIYITNYQIYEFTYLIEKIIQKWTSFILLYCFIPNYKYFPSRYFITKKNTKGHLILPFKKNKYSRLASTIASSKFNSSTNYPLLLQL